MLFMTVIFYYLVVRPVIRLLLLKMKYKNQINVYFFPVAGFFSKIGTRTKDNKDGFLHFLRGLTKNIQPEQKETHKLATVANL